MRPDNYRRHMRQLRFVRAGDDQDHVILETADGGEQFVLRVDTSMRDAARSDLPRLHPPAPEPTARIGPREIQMRVRAGALPQELADENEMTIERVMRFAGPVLDERARMADESRRARARRSTNEGAAVIFGEAVDERFGAHGIDVSAVRWDARRRDDGQWIISAAWLGGDAERLAEWAFHLGSRSVTPLDDTAADLLSDRPIRAIVSAEQVRVDQSSAPPLAPGVVAFPAMPDAHTGKLPHVDDVFDQDAADPDKPRSAKRVAARNEPAAAAEDYDAPPLPLRLADANGDTLIPSESSARTARVKNLGIASRDDETDEQRAERAHIPSWDDIMLGVRRKSD
jgi:hypothetical protein